jgi:hypothetical protein
MIEALGQRATGRVNDPDQPGIYSREYGPDRNSIGPVPMPLGHMVHTGRKTTAISVSSCSSAADDLLKTTRLP